MKTATKFRCEKNERRPFQGAAGRGALLMALALGALLGVGAFWALQKRAHPAETSSTTVSAPTNLLSDVTMQLLHHLDANVELRWYAPADLNSLPPELRDYLARVDELLAEYKREADGKLTLDRHDPQIDANAKTAASAAGIVPFSTPDGEIVYLGLTVASGRQMESIAPLRPEWETALESDISRAIQRVTAKLPSGVQRPFLTPARVSQPASIDPAISDELLKQFPDLNSRSFAEMAQVLRVAALDEFSKATTEMQSKVADAQKALADTRANKSAVAQQEALQNLQRIQAEQADKIKGITARLQERIRALELLTSAPQLSAPAK